MKILKTLSVSLLLASALVGSVSAKVNPLSVNLANTPDKTVVIKHPAAANVNNYFSSATLITFEVYKVGSAADAAKVISTFQSEPGVDGITQGIATGDYQAYTLSLKSAKNKAWFATTLKKAGLNNIKINNNPIVAVDQM